MMTYRGALLINEKSVGGALALLGVTVHCDGVWRPATPRQTPTQKSVCTSSIPTNWTPVTDRYDHLPSTETRKMLMMLLLLMQIVLVWSTRNALSHLCIYTVSQKVPTFKLSVTMSSLNRFSKFLHCWKAYEICYKTHSTLPTSPHLRVVVTLPWEIKNSNFPQIFSRYGRKCKQIAWSVPILIHLSM